MDSLASFNKGSRKNNFTELALRFFSFPRRSVGTHIIRVSTLENGNQTKSDIYKAEIMFEGYPFF